MDRGSYNDDKLNGLGRLYDEELYHETIEALSNVKRDKPLN